MTLAAVLAAAGLALGAVAWLYWRRQTPDQRAVPTLLFWTAVSDAGATIRWRGEWRERLSLLLHLLAALLLAALLAWAWRLWGAQPAPRLIVLESGPWRELPAETGGSLGAAQFAAMERELASGGTRLAALMEAGGRVLAGWTEDRAVLAARAVAWAQAAGSSPEPVSPAPPVGVPWPNDPALEVVWIGPNPPPEGVTPARWVQLAPQTGANTGVVRWAARRDATDPGLVWLEAEILQVGGARSGMLEWRRDGALRGRESWSLVAGERRRWRWRERADLDDSTWSVHLAHIADAAAGPADHWQADDTATLQLAAVPACRVGLAGPVPPPLAVALAARPRVVVETVPGGDDAGAGFDLVVAAGPAAAAGWRAAAQVWRLAPAAAGPWGEAASVTGAVVALPPPEGAERWWSDADPTALVWPRVAGVRAAAGWQTLLEGLDEAGEVWPLFLASPTGARPEIVWAAPADSGEWLERPVFPILVGTLLDGAGAPASGVQATVPGEAATLLAGGGAAVSPAGPVPAADKIPATGRPLAALVPQSAGGWMVLALGVWLVLEAFTFTRRWTT